MAYVVRLDWLDNMLPEERIHLWVLTWDAVAGEFRGISSANWGPAAQVRLTAALQATDYVFEPHCWVFMRHYVPGGLQNSHVSMRSLSAPAHSWTCLAVSSLRPLAWTVTWDGRNVSCNCAVQVLSAAGAAWFIGGGEDDVARLLQPDSINSSALQYAHFPGETWQLDHWDAVPAGGNPSAAYIGAIR